MTDPLIAVVITDQEFSAPDLSVLAVADPVADQADTGFADTVFSHATGQVSMMMLDRDAGQPVVLCGPLPGVTG